jgi:bifunctional DNA-binding transcriptional regulator/antitoxin component of YhaV-PrlF toxin-antitoxin module
MPRVNGNGKINVPAEIVTRMNGKPGDEIFFIEELEPVEGDSIIKSPRTHKLVIMLKTVWDEEMKKVGEENGDKVIKTITDIPEKEDEVIFEEKSFPKTRKNKYSI